MQFYEFQAKKLLRQYGVETPSGNVALTPDEAEAAAGGLAAGPLFVKAQILAGDRASARGVRAVTSAAAARSAASEMLGKPLVTSQTGPAGYPVNRVLIEAGVAATQELYLALQVDGRSGSLVAIAGPHGDIEARLAADAADLHTVRLGVKGKSGDSDIADFCRRLGLADGVAAKFRDLVEKLRRAFLDLDASLIEISPLVVTASGNLVAVDVKLVTDDNATFRHPEIAELRDERDVDQIQLRAQRHQINYVPMDGDIGTIVNGAGLGLATLDMIRAAGGSPANFMDIRTTAKSLDIADGIGLILDNPRVKVVLVNVFGGGMQPCDTIVDGLAIAFRRSGRTLPVILRIVGNNESFARMRLANFSLPKTECADMWQAVTQATAIAKGRA